MQRFYSPSLGTTYFPAMHANIPDDAIAITEALYLSVIANPPMGKVRSHDASGLPILIDPPRLQPEYDAQTAMINAACEAAITAGFWSSALGIRHQYSSELNDQLNLTGAVLAGLDTLYACRDEAGVREFRPHTYAQIRQVGDDFTLIKQQLLQKAYSLKQLLDDAFSAGDLEALEAVKW